MERRTKVRYKLCAPVLLEWTDATGSVIRQGGFSRDISTGGLYIYCSKQPNINQSALCEVLLPLNRERHFSGLRLKAVINVVRIETEKKETGFAGTGELTQEDHDEEDEREVSIGQSRDVAAPSKPQHCRVTAPIFNIRY